MQTKLKESIKRKAETIRGLRKAKGEAKAAKDTQLVNKLWATRQWERWCARVLLVAYAFVRRRPYAALERKPDPEDVYRLKFAVSRVLGLETHTEVEAWLGAET